MPAEQAVVGSSDSDDSFNEPPQIRTKFNISMEKKIERLLYESERHGWDFSQFVASTLEILTILHHRNKIRSSGRATRKVSRKRVQAESALFPAYRADQA
jgi:hypothetical protein